MIILNTISIIAAFVRLKKIAAFILFLLLFSSVCGAQGLSLQVSVTHENCPGNGTLTFSVTGAAPSPAVNYKVVRMPSTTVADGPETTINSLQAGTYTVTATQTVNGTTSTSQVQAVIENQTTPLTYTVTGQKPACVNDGTITINVDTGNAVSYEILSPIQVPPQTSNTFYNIEAGFYVVRATNACGEGVVVSFTLFSDQVSLNVTDAIFPDEILPSCNLIKVANIVTSANSLPLQMPITAVYTIYPPDGSTPVVLPATVTMANENQVLFGQTIPFYYQTPYNCELVVTDRCGTTYTNVTVINQSMQASLGFDKPECLKVLMVGASNVVPPINITFTQVPPGVDMSMLNDAYPGPYGGNFATFGAEDYVFPLGIYAVEITDSCGNTSTAQTELIQDPPPLPIIVPSNNDCLNNLGNLEMLIPPHIIVEIHITDAPDEYTETLPQDVLEYVEGDDGLLMGGLPPGNYYFDFTDDCGTLYEDILVQIPNYTNNGIVALQRPDCTPGLGSAMLGSGLTEALVLEAPAGANLPADITPQIAADGNLYLEGLLPGSYKFKLTSPCTGTIEKPLTVIGNEITQNDYVYKPYCGSFDLEMHHTSTATASVQFWLQKEYGTGTGIWGHPDGTMQYDGTVIDGTVAVGLQNNTTNYNLVYPTGHYRVMKTFRSFSPDADSGLKTCTLEIYQFDYYNTLQIIGVESLTCGGGPTDVQVDVIGVEPMTFTVISKDGIAQNTTNGNSNIFLALDPAAYTIQVNDPCGEYRTFSFNVADLPPPVYAYTAADLNDCDPDGNGTQTFDLSAQSSAILGSQDISIVSLTYHASLADATLNVNALPLTLTTATTTVYARVEVITNPTLCYAISSFDITVYNKAELSMNDLVHGCENEPNTITADAGYISYLWSTGENTASIYPEHAGTFSVIAEDANGCSAEKTVTLITTAAPVITSIDVSDWTDNSNSIAVYLAPFEGSEQDVEFSIDGINWQDSNVFTGLEPGKYFIYARDRRGCGDAAPFSTFLLTYPRFFTPNGDSYNETWRIKFAASAEPDMMVYIYDRFGKLITGFDSHSPGWDGTLNGSPLPGSDYWFVVRRQNSVEYKGHFALIR